jgi:hypothetical protein
VLHVDMCARLLPGEEIESIPARAEDGGTHGATDYWKNVV